MRAMGSKLATKQRGDRGTVMKVAAGRQFFVSFGEEARQIVPDLNWALFEPDGTWSDVAEDADLVVLAGDSYTPAFIEAAANFNGPSWAHTEDAGTDGFFYDAMHSKGTIISHSPGANAPEVAEFAVGLVLHSAKRLKQYAVLQRERRWQELELQSLSDKTALVIGLGSIGGRIALMLKAFGMRVLGIRQSEGQVRGVDRQGTQGHLDEFLLQADFVILALPGSAATKDFIAESELALMKSTATLINVARGALVNMEALKGALRTGVIYEAYLDVFPTEPWPKDDELWAFSNVFLTPHTASTSPLYLPRVGRAWLENLRRFSHGKDLLHRVSA